MSATEWGEKKEEEQPEKKKKKKKKEKEKEEEQGHTKGLKCFTGGLTYDPAKESNNLFMKE